MEWGRKGNSVDGGGGGGPTRGGDWEEQGQLLVGAGEWGAGPGDGPPPAGVSSPCFPGWVGADIHASWLQDALFSVTNWAEELSDRQHGPGLHRAGLPLSPRAVAKCWAGPGAGQGAWAAWKQSGTGVLAVEPGRTHTAAWVSTVLIRGGLGPPPSPCLLHPSLPTWPTSGPLRQDTELETHWRTGGLLQPGGQAWLGPRLPPWGP